MNRNEINIEKFIKPYNDKLKYLIENNLIKYESNSSKANDDSKFINYSLTFSLKDKYEDDLIISIDGKEYKMHLPSFSMMTSEEVHKKLYNQKFVAFIEKEYEYIYEKTYDDILSCVTNINELIKHRYCLSIDKLDPENYNYILKCYNEKSI